MHARTGLATDLELFDGYPTKYLSYTKRTHRWIRGDWQIARYVFKRELSVISRWKIVDNLRRSLEAPMQLLILFLAFSYLHSIFGLLMGIFLLSLLLPTIWNVAGRVIDRSMTVRILKYELRLGLSQALFALAVLPFQAYIQTDAIIRSLGRQMITKRSLLEWEPAADSEKRLALDMKTFYFRMYPGTILSLFFIIGFAYTTLATGLLLLAFLLTWLSSPVIAYKLSLPYPEQVPDIEAADQADLRKWSRQLWAFFDLFVNEENRFLPPDNIQLEPYKGVAPYISDNIGLLCLPLCSEDLGYIPKTPCER